MNAEEVFDRHWRQARQTVKMTLVATMRLKRGMPDFAGKVACVHLLASSTVLILLIHGHFTDGFAVLEPLFHILSFPLLMAFLVLTVGAGSVPQALVGVLVLGVNSFLVGHLVARARSWFEPKKPLPEMLHNGINSRAKTTCQDRPDDRRKER